MRQKRKIEYLVGKNSKLNRTFEPFNLLVINFLDDFSKSLDFKIQANDADYDNLTFSILTLKTWLAVIEWISSLF